MVAHYTAILPCKPPNYGGGGKCKQEDMGWGEEVGQPLGEPNSLPPLLTGHAKSRRVALPVLYLWIAWPFSVQLPPHGLLTDKDLDGDTGRVFWGVGAVYSSHCVRGETHVGLLLAVGKLW